MEYFSSHPGPLSADTAIRRRPGRVLSRRIAFLLSAFWLLLLYALPALAADYVFHLPYGVKIGEIDGPGREQLRRILIKRTTKGPTEFVLSGVVSLEQSSRKEKERVPLEKPSGPPYDDYLPDPFTKRVWRQKVTPATSSLDSFDLERYLGFMTLDWTVSKAGSGELLDQGRVVLDINRTRGGYLAVEGMVPKMSSKSADNEFENRLANDLIRLLALDLGRAAGVSELERGDDKWSRSARSLASSGDWEGARKEWEKLLEMNPKYGPALYNLGVYWERNRKPEEALRYYRSAFVSDASERHRRALTRLTETLRRAGRLPDRMSQSGLD